MKAMAQGFARVKRTRAELLGHARDIIERAQRQVRTMMTRGLIRPPPR